MRQKPLIAAAGFAVFALGALLVARPGALTGEAGAAGCEGTNAAADFELARSEARYLVMEVGVALGIAIAQTDRFVELATPLISTAAAGQTPPAACYATQVIPQQSANPKVKVDFSNCPGETGSVEMGMAAGLPAGVDPSMLPPEVVAAAGDLPQGSVQYDMLMTGTKTSGVLLEGGFKITTTAATSALDMDINFDFLDYSGDLDVDGTIETAEGVDSVTMAGTFVSSSSLTWTIEASNLGVAEGCRGLKSGRMVGTYDGGEMGKVEVVATFDGACDGCANITVDGAEAPKICIPEQLSL